MGRVFRWVVATLLVVGAAAVVYIVEPTTCEGDMCSDNVLADLLIMLAGIVTAVRVLTLRRRRGAQ